MTTKVRREFESLASAAERTGLSIRTLRRRIASGHLAAYRSGARVIRVDPDDVDRMMVRIAHRLELMSSRPAAPPSRSRTAPPNDKRRNPSAQRATAPAAAGARLLPELRNLEDVDQGLSAKRCFWPDTPAAGRRGRLVTDDRDNHGHELDAQGCEEEDVVVDRVEPVSGPRSPSWSRPPGTAVRTSPARTGC